ncbi:MAG: ABC transporter permease [Bacilli bacterium]|nr:ABC transporter permease [Bacilli bacterium]
MYIIKSAFRNMIRNKGKNTLIAVIMTIVILCTCVGLSINSAGENLVQIYKKTNPLEVSFKLDMQSLRGASDDVKNSFQSITIDDINEYVDSDYVKDYYYTLESSISSSSISPVEDNVRTSSDYNEGEDGRLGFNKKMQDAGDFRITSYSNFAYLDDFTSSIKKITSGQMIDDSFDGNIIVISEALAKENDLDIDSEITFYIPSNEDYTMTFKVVGIYEDNSLSDSDNFMNMNALNSSNQIYTNIESVQEILNNSENDNSKIVSNNGLNVKVYLKNNDGLEKYTKEVQSKGLSDYYSVVTNEDNILRTLKPVQNIASFSLTFLIVILIIGIVILMVINFLNIRDRKYEIGVLRAIGMSKIRVTTLLILEIFFVALISLFVGTFGGAILSQPITNKMLASEISSYNEDVKNIQGNFGGHGFERPSRNVNDMYESLNMNGKKSIGFSNTDYVDSLTVKLDIVTILQLFIIVILLTITSGFVASMFVNKYNPNKILQNRV